MENSQTTRLNAARPRRKARSASYIRDSIIPTSKLSRTGYNVSERNKSELYLEFLPIVNSGKVELLDSKRLVEQLCSLERSTARGTGRDTVDHPSGPNWHDDVANAVAGALVLAVGALAGLELWSRFGENFETNMLDAFP